MMKKRFWERFAVPTGTWALAGLCGAMLPLTGCIHEGPDDCNCESCLYIVVDREGADEADDPNGATVFLFNSDRTYTSLIEVSAEHIAAGTPVPFAYRCDDLPWVSVWGNLGDGEEVSPLVPGARMENMYVALRKDAEEYAVGADPLFFGAKQLAGESVERVVITPKTGRLAVTVRGLPAGSDPEQYFLTVETPHDRYDFAGTSLSGQAALRFSGVFRGNDLVTAEPYHLVHFPLSGSGDQHMIVNLYERGVGTDAPRLIATTDRDTEAQPINILRGKTTNVLIVLDPTGELIVLVEVTDWDEMIEQWAEW